MDTEGYTNLQSSSSSSSLSYLFSLQSLQQEYQVLTGKLEENSTARQVCVAQEMPQSARGKCNIVLKVWYPRTTIGQYNIMY